MNQLLWYYADLEKQRCLADINSNSNAAPQETELLGLLGGRKSNKVLWVIYSCISKWISLLICIFSNNKVYFLILVILEKKTKKKFSFVQ